MGLVPWGQALLELVRLCGKTCPSQWVRPTITELVHEKNVAAIQSGGRQLFDNGTQIQLVCKRGHQWEYIHRQHWLKGDGAGTKTTATADRQQFLPQRNSLHQGGGEIGTHGVKREVEAGDIPLTTVHRTTGLSATVSLGAARTRFQWGPIGTLCDVCNLSRRAIRCRSRVECRSHWLTRVSSQGRLASWNFARRKPRVWGTEPQHTHTHTHRLDQRDIKRVESGPVVSNPHNNYHENTSDGVSDRWGIMKRKWAVAKGERVGKVLDEVTGLIGGVIVRYPGVTLISQVNNFPSWHFLFATLGLQNESIHGSRGSYQKRPLWYYVLSIYVL